SGSQDHAVPRMAAGGGCRRHSPPENSQVRLKAAKGGCREPRLTRFEELAASGDRIASRHLAANGQAALALSRGHVVFRTREDAALCMGEGRRSDLAGHRDRTDRQHPDSTEAMTGCQKHDPEKACPGLDPGCAAARKRSCSNKTCTL